MRALFASVICAIACIGHAGQSIAENLPRSILVLVQSDPRGPFHAELFGAFRSVIDNEANSPISIYLEYLDRSRFTSPAYQEEQSRHLASKYKDRPIGVIAGFGAGTLTFIAPLRESAFPGVPLVFGQLDETTYKRFGRQPNSTGNIVRLELTDMLTAARAVAPKMKNVAIVGDALDGQPVFRHFVDAIPEVAKQYNVIDLTGLRMAELQTRVAMLPPDTAILYTAIYSDGEGTYYPPADALKLFAGKANRPIIIAVESNLGTGAAGGYLLAAGPLGTSAARLALRVLDGETADSIPVTKLDAVKPVFDWRQLERWAVPASALPAGSEVRFRPPGASVQTYAQTAAVAGVVFVLAGVTGFAFYEHAKRRRAEASTRQRIGELALVNRQATAGEMSAAIAHELNQPLGAILNNTEAAELILNSNSPNIIQLRELLSDIRHSDQRASDILRQLRALMSKNTSTFREINISQAAREAMDIAMIQANASNVTVHPALTPEALDVTGDKIQLQQVVLNLVINGIEAVKGRPAAQRNVVVSTSCPDGKFVEVTVSDSGPGIATENLPRVFDPFFSTKENGMGMGLSLCRTIIEAHNGAIWAENGLAGGAAFHFRLPLVNRRLL
jgi:signal transduction histidine kinase